MTSETTGSAAGGGPDAERLMLLQAAVAQASDAIVITTAGLDPPGPVIVYVNPAFTRMTGYAAEEIVGRTPRILQGPRTDRALLDALRTACGRGDGFQGRTYNYRRDGREYVVDWQIAPIRDPAGTVTHFVAIQQDVTDLTLLEAQLRQATKLEALGRLAGGVAHDFNNLLTVIGASARFLREHHGPGTEPGADVDEIDAAVQRASALTRQLLAFSRQQVRQPQPLDLNAVVGDVERMLTRVIGEDVRLVTALAAGVVPVLADRGQLEQVLLNLAVNARDAMPDGGTLALHTQRVPTAALPPGRAPRAAGDGAPPAEVALLGVADTGAGMDAHTLERAFEPFFTTKDPAKGTGLGLATVHGIAEQSGGTVWIDSRPGEGTQVWLALPLLARHATPAAGGAIVPPPSGVGTVLLVEDDAAVRALARRMLTRGGYAVLEARSGRDALARWEEREGRGVDVVVTDMVMPDGAGHELIHRLRLERPTLPVVLLSGYAPDARVEALLASGDPYTAFLEKPFTPDALLEHVARVRRPPADA